ncbi:MAG TPA: hypothetical protein VL172_19760 [Kofleriaceae bacterium]|nr:hypothetical protein [Kofleriaceae bacterium]
MRTLAPLLLLLPACAMGGAMRQATLSGQCAEDDVACSRRHPQAPLAVGTRFYPDVSAEIAGATTPTLRLESAAPDVVAVDDDALVARAAGASAVLIATDDGTVVDFVHVWVAPITRITLARRDGDRIAGAVGLAVGEDVTLTPALWNHAQRLGGDADATWTVSDESVVSVLRDGSSDRRRLRARSPGKATLTVAVGNAHTSIDVEVVQ